MLCEYTCIWKICIFHAKLFAWKDYVAPISHPEKKNINKKTTKAVCQVQNKSWRPGRERHEWAEKRWLNLQRSKLALVPFADLLFQNTVAICSVYQLYPVRDRHQSSETSVSLEKWCDWENGWNIPPLNSIFCKQDFT